MPLRNLSSVCKRNMALKNWVGGGGVGGARKNKLQYWELSKSEARFPTHLHRT